MTAQETLPRPLTILVDDQPQLEYKRDKPLSESQRGSLVRMDKKMDAGIRLGDGHIEMPDALQRAQFVAIQILEALQVGNEALIAAGCAYLASRMPDLTQVKAKFLSDAYSVELVFNEPYVQEVAVDFQPRPQS